MYYMDMYFSYIHIYRNIYIYYIYVIYYMYLCMYVCMRTQFQKWVNH